jgi:murein DD-endopeptidase MepM/ murein hydrolase activator NlpD
MRRSSAYISVLLCILLLFASVGVAFGATQDELDEARQKAADARAAAEAAGNLAEKLKAETEALDAEIANLESAVRELDPEIVAATDRTQRLRDEVKTLEGKITELEGEIDKTQAEFDKQQGLLNERMATSYRQGELFYLDMLLSAKDFNDLIARTTLVQRVIESNQDIAIALDDTKRELTSTRNELDRTLGTVKNKQAEAEAVEKDLKRLQANRQSKVNQQEAIQAEKNSLMAQAEKDKDKYLELAAAEEAAAAQIAAALRGGGSGSSTGGGEYAGSMSWPVPGGSVTSSYGWRTHPIFGTKKFHHGIDISKGGGVVVAAGSGTVIRAAYGWGGGYGNQIWIDHGDGLVTTYNHLADGSFKVSSGASVSAGSAIANVGSTGYSTGPHLHFEVRVNGDSRNPMNYF